MGQNCFNDVASRSIFQQSSGNGSKLTMHHFIYDLTELVSKDSDPQNTSTPHSAYPLITVVGKEYSLLILYLLYTLFIVQYLFTYVIQVVHLKTTMPVYIFIIQVLVFGKNNTGSADFVALSSWCFATYCALYFLLLLLPTIIQVVAYVIITYPMIGYHALAIKIFWNFYALFCTILYFSYLGILLVSLTPNVMVASILFCFLHHIHPFLPG